MQRHVSETSEMLLPEIKHILKQTANKVINIVLIENLIKQLLFLRQILCRNIFIAKVFIILQFCHKIVL